MFYDLHNIREAKKSYRRRLRREMKNEVNFIVRNKPLDSINLREPVDYKGKLFYRKCNAYGYRNLSIFNRSRNKQQGEKRVIHHDRKLNQTQEFFKTN